MFENPQVRLTTTQTSDSVSSVHPVLPHEGLFFCSQLKKPLQGFCPTEQTFLCEVQNVTCINLLQKGTELVVLYAMDPGTDAFHNNTHNTTRLEELAAKCLLVNNAEQSRAISAPYSDSFL